MSYKTSTYIVLSLLFVLAIAYGWQGLSFQDMRNRNSVGPGYFPIALAVALAVLCIAGAVRNQMQENRHVEIPNLGLILATLAITAAFLVGWAMLGLFYAFAFAFVFVLFVLYERDRSAKRVAIRFALAAGVTLFIYLLFGQLIQVRF